MKIISTIWDKLGEKYTSRNIMVVLAFLFFIAIFFAPIFSFGIMFVIYFIAYMAVALDLDAKTV